MLTAEKRYDFISTFKAVGLGIVPFFLWAAIAFYNPPDCGTLAAAMSRGSSRDAKNEEERNLAVALEDFNRFSALVDSQERNETSFDDVFQTAKERPVMEAALLLAPHLSIDYSWNPELKDAIAKFAAENFLSASDSGVFPVPEKKELRLKLPNDETHKGKLKSEYARFRVFPFASGMWTQWCLLSEGEREAAVKGPLFELALWLSLCLSLGSLIFYFMVRHWCETCGRSHWTWCCPNETESENKGNLKGVLAGLAVYVGMFAFMGWKFVGWDNVATLSKTLKHDAGESADWICTASPTLIHDYQLELLEAVKKAQQSWILPSSEKTDLESEFLRVIVLNDMSDDIPAETGKSPEPPANRQTSVRHYRLVPDNQSRRTEWWKGWTGFAIKMGVKVGLPLLALIVAVFAGKKKKKQEILKLCPLCGSPVDEHGNCPKCGVPDGRTGGVFCPRCGGPVDKYGYCPICGVPDGLTPGTFACCPTCGSRIINGECPNGCPKTEYCPSCESELLPDGSCPKGCTIVRCGNCNTILVDGFCPNGCNAEPFHFGWPGAQRPPMTQYALEVVSPAEYAGFRTAIPASFVIGRSAKGAREPFLELHVLDPAMKASCSRRYVELTRDGENGFQVRMLKNYNFAVVCGRWIRKEGESALLSPDGLLMLNPDFKLKLVRTNAEDDLK